jgi:hypothetical protein
MNHEIVDRPSNATPLKPTDSIIEALVATEQTGKAVKVPMTQAEIDLWQARVRTTLRSLGYRMSYRRNREENYLIAWTYKHPA